MHFRVKRSDGPLRALALALTLATIFLPAAAAASNYCGQYNFNAVNPPDRSRTTKRALARVYAATATPSSNHEGAATVIRTQPMLLVTAGHVAPQESAQVSFPNLDPKRLYSAKVIARPTKPAGTRVVAEPADFAVLHVENPPAGGVSALETWLDEVNSEIHHDFAGYARDSPDPVLGGGQLSHHSDCAWRLRETTFNGDSGGAVVSESGLLVGIVIDGREGGRFSGGAMGQATVLPLSCVRDTVLSALDNVLPVSAANILDVERSVLVQQLRPPPTSGWIDNAGLARGLRDLLKNQSWRVNCRGATLLSARFSNRPWIARLAATWLFA